MPSRKRDEPTGSAGETASSGAGSRTRSASGARPGARAGRKAKAASGAAPGAGRKAKAVPPAGRKAKAASGAAPGAGRRAKAVPPSVDEVLAGQPPGSLTLVIAEKPSVARDLARTLGRDGRKFAARQGFLEGPGYLVTWAIGHLLELAEPEDYRADWKRWSLETLPIDPGDGFKLKPLPRTKAQLDVILTLLRSSAVREVVNACDAGREGELIFRHLMEAAGSSLPVKRLWISAMTDEAVNEGFASLRDGRDYDLLGAAARCRSESDWLVGINATRGMTKKCGVLLSVGRVQTPTLAILVEREKEIQGFVPEKYWEVEATFDVVVGPSGAADRPSASYRGAWFSPEAADGRLGDAGTAAALADKVRGRPGRVEDVEKTQRTHAAPLLYDLTQLQRDMNRRHGFAASRTLRIAQDLYEKYKVITYPRTDSRFLSGRMVPVLAPTMRAVAEVSPALAAAAAPLLEAGRLPVSGRQVNDSRVRDHHAIIPTLKAAAAAKLRGDHQKVFEAVARRFIATFYRPAVVEHTTVVTLVEGERFRSRGRTVVERGWLDVEEAGWLTGTPRAAGENDIAAELPPLEKGQVVATATAEALEKATKPPPRYTEASLLQIMEGAGKLVDDEELQEAMKERGIGTPATRAAIIERLIEVGYLDRDRRSLVPTPKGVELVTRIPTRDLVSPALTGLWESKLRQVERGDVARESFMQEIRTFVQRIVNDILALDAEGLAVLMTRTVGRCPRCGAEIIESRKAYTCARWREGCGFHIWKVIAGRLIRPLEASKLIADGRTYLLRGFRSRAGRRFAAFLVLTDDGVKFAFPERPAAGKGGEPGSGRPGPGRGSDYGPDQAPGPGQGPGPDESA